MDPDGLPHSGNCDAARECVQWPNRLLHESCKCAWIPRRSEKLIAGRGSEVITGPITLGPSLPLHTQTRRTPGRMPPDWKQALQDLRHKALRGSLAKTFAR